MAAKQAHLRPPLACAGRLKARVSGELGLGNVCVRQTRVFRFYLGVGKGEQIGGRVVYNSTKQLSATRMNDSVCNLVVSLSFYCLSLTTLTPPQPPRYKPIARNNKVEILRLDRETTF